MKFKKMLVVLVFILIVTRVYGLGIAPAKTTLEYKTGEQDGAIRIVVDQVPTKVILTTDGELAKYIQLDQDKLILQDQETWIKFKVNLPDDLGPGVRTGGIMILQIPTDTSNDGNVVMAAPAVVHQVIVNVPYPGKYMEGKLYITNIKLNDPILFTIALSNFGKEKIENAKATIVIKGPTNDEVVVLHTDSNSVDPNKEQQLSATWQTPNAGRYVAEATIDYDGQILQLSGQFDVGNLDVSIEKIQVDNFKIGQIAKLDIYLLNKWNSPMNVSGRVEIFKDKALVSSFNTVPVDVEQGSESIMNAYWNTEGVNVGSYDMSVKADYNGKSTEKTFNSFVSIDKIQFKDFVSGKVTSAGSQNTTLLVIAVFILIIVNIFLFIYIRKKFKGASQ